MTPKYDDFATQDAIALLSHRHNLVTAAGIARAMANGDLALSLSGVQLISNALNAALRMDRG